MKHPSKEQIALCQKKYNVHSFIDLPNPAEPLSDIEYIVNKYDIPIDVQETFKNIYQKQYERFLMYPKLYTNVNLIDVSIDNLNTTLEYIMKYVDRYNVN